MNEGYLICKKESRDGEPTQFAWVGGNYVLLDWHFLSMQGIEGYPEHLTLGEYELDKKQQLDGAAYYVRTNILRNSGG